jgi:hypothetical protein
VQQTGGVDELERDRDVDDVPQTRAAAGAEDEQGDCGADALLRRRSDRRDVGGALSATHSSARRCSTSSSRATGCRRNRGHRGRRVAVRTGNCDVDGAHEPMRIMSERPTLSRQRRSAPLRVAGRRWGRAMTGGRRLRRDPPPRVEARASWSDGYEASTCDYLRDHCPCAMPRHPGACRY